MVIVITVNMIMLHYAEPFPMTYSFCPHSTPQMSCFRLIDRKSWRKTQMLTWASTTPWFGWMAEAWQKQPLHTVAVSWYPDIQCQWRSKDKNTSLVTSQKGISHTHVSLYWVYHLENVAMTKLFSNSTNWMYFEFTFVKITSPHATSSLQISMVASAPASRAASQARAILRQKHKMPRFVHVHGNKCTKVGWTYAFSILGGWTLQIQICWCISEVFGLQRWSAVMIIALSIGK